MCPWKGGITDHPLNPLPPRDPALSYNQVMATNLMTLEGKQTTVAVVGLAHVDGIEGILVANGWKAQGC